MTYFNNIHSLDDLKAVYRRLAMKNHPDHGGSVEIMQQINAEHDALFETLKKKHNASADEYHQTTETPEEFREIIMKLIIIPGLDIELCGSWLWIGGNTREHKEELKALSCRWSKNKKLWYWHHAEEGRKWRRGTYSMNEIRTKYGSQTFKGQSEESNYTRIGAKA